MGLIEESQNPVAVLETSHAGTSCDDSAGAIGGGNDGKVNWEAIFALLKTDELLLEGTQFGETLMLPWE